MSNISTKSPSQDMLPPLEFGERFSTPLERLIQVIEISFIFLLVYSLILLVDAVFDRFGLYSPLSSVYLGRPSIGSSLDGGNLEAIIRVTLIFNLLLFVFSLVFGIWIRRTRDGWTLAQLGYTFSTKGYGFWNLVRKSIVLGLLGIVVFLGFMTVASIAINGLDRGLLFNAYTYEENGEVIFFDQKALLAEYYFGFFEMSLIWPVSAGFFFFAYAYNSLRARFEESIANLLSSLFYVFYLSFFFLISSSDKLTQFLSRLVDPFARENLMFWSMAFALLLVVYTFFSAFAETRSLVLPFTANLVFNAGLTVIRSWNSILLGSERGSGFSYWVVLLPSVVVVFLLGVWFFIDRDSFFTLSISLRHLKQTWSEISFRSLGYLVLFVLLSFVLPSFLAEVLISPERWGGDWVIPVIFGLELILLLFLAIIVLTYDPNEVYDVLLISKEAGQPIASHIELFQTDEVLISGFFTALSSVGEELEHGSSRLKTVRLGDKTVLIEEGVFTRLVALADKEQPSIRNNIAKLHRAFEVKHGEEAIQLFGDIPEEAQELVDQVGNLSITFYVPAQVRWLGVLTMVITPLMLVLIGLL